MVTASPPCHYRRVHTTTFQEQVLLVKSQNRDVLIRLDGSALRIWESLEYPISLEGICARLAGEYARPPETLAGEIEGFLAGMRERGFVETQSPPSPVDENRYRYLGLLKRSLVNLLYPEHELRIQALPNLNGTLDPLERVRLMRDIRYRMPDAYASLVASKRDGHHTQHPYLFPHTLIGLQRLENLERCAEQVFADGVPGDFIEAGAWQGGAAIFLRSLQVVWDQPERRTWVADSFQGMPPATSEVDLRFGADFPESKCPILAYSLEAVRDNFVRYALLDDRVVFLPGWFADTLPTAPIGPLAILRIDADLYQSTKEVLESLYAKVAPGGFIIVDDYGSFPGCRQAVDEFRERHGICDPLKRIDWEGVYWRRSLA